MPNKDADKQAIADRLLSLMKKLGYKNEREWALALGYSRPDNIYNATGAERMPGLQLLIDISNKFEQVNINWVLTGKGEAIKKESGSDGPDHLLTAVKQEAEIMRLSLERLLTAAGETPGLNRPVADPPKSMDLILDKKYAAQSKRTKKGTASEKGN